MKNFIINIFKLHLALKNNKFLFFNKNLSIAILFLFIFTNQTLAFSSIEIKEVKIKADGFVIKKSKQPVSAYLIQPNAKLEFHNNSKDSKKLKIKIDNISLERYEIKSERLSVVKKGKRYIIFEIGLSPEEKSIVFVSPKLKDPKVFTFAVLGDSRYGTRIHQKILNEIQKTNAIFAINLGDIVNKGSKSEYESYVKEIGDFSLPYFVVPGNHEIVDPKGRKYFQEYVNPLSYSFKMGKFNFIILDNTGKGISDAHYRQMINVLSLSSYNFIFVHIPAFSPWTQHKDHGMSKKEAKYFMDIMNKYKVPYVFAGHTHGHNITQKKQTKYVISGCAGASPYVFPTEGGFYHYMLIHVNHEKIKHEVVKVNPLF